MKPYLAHHSRERGVALVTTVIVVAVLAVVAVAFMQSTTTDRLSARSVANYTRATLAAEAGLAAAEATLARAMTNDTFIVVANTNRQLFVGNGTNSTNFSYTPAFSTVSTLSAAVSNLVTAGIPSTNVAGGILFTNQMPGGLSITSPAVSWVFLTTTNAAGATVTNGRFAYWVEDLGGRLDVSVVGVSNTANVTNARRLTGTNPAEIALWSLFNTNLASDPGNAVSTKLVAARSNIPTPATARLVDPAAVLPSMMADLAAGLRHDTNEPMLIPFGLGYAGDQEGKPKLDLNAFVSSGSLEDLVDAITNNIRNPANRGFTFASTNRSGGISGERYVNALAASIIDYVDADNQPTVGNAGGGAFRGIEGLPFVTETATAIQWMAHGTNIPPWVGRTSAAWADEIHVENYVELWNPTDQPFTGILDLVFSNEYAGGSINGFPIDLTITNSTANRTLTNTSGFTPPNYQINVSVPLEPNEYRVYSLGTNIYRFKVANSATPAADPLYDRGLRASAGGRLRLGRPPTGATDSFGSSLTLSFGGVMYDRVAAIHRVGPRVLYCRPFAAGPDALPDWAGNVPALRAYPTESPALPGDPRMGFYLTITNNAQGYASTPANPGSSMGFRNNGTSSGGTMYNTEPNRWLDGGHTNSPLRSGSITDGNRPNTNRQTTAHTNDFVQRLNNTGSWTNVLELGNIFDPMAWGAPVGSSAITQTMAAAGNASTTVTFGGGNTLRIGRFEHPRFTNDGLRASQLLDIFAVGPKVGDVVVNRIPGRINLNTATTNALRALAAGVRHSVDRSMLPADLDVPAAAVSAFVTGVTNFRSQRPFYSTSQLNMLSTNDAGSVTWADGAVFGRANLLGVTAWGDRAAEEWFSRIYHLSTVRSRNFLVHVVGQSLQTNNVNNVLSTSRQVFQVYVQPLRGSDGLTTNNTVRKINQWEL
jgi:hypothetical protein